MRLIGPALLVVLLLRLQDLDPVLAALRWDDAGLLSAGVVLGVLAYPLKALRWRTLLAARGHRYSLWRALLSLLSAGYVGHLTPGRVGDLFDREERYTTLDAKFAAVSGFIAERAVGRA